MPSPIDVGGLQGSRWIGIVTRPLRELCELCVEGFCRERRIYGIWKPLKT